MDSPRVYFSTLRPSAEDDKIEACCNAICLTSGAPLSSAMRRTGKFQRDRYKSEPSLGTGWTAASNEAAHVAGAVFQQPGESKMHYRSRKAFQLWVINEWLRLTAPDSAWSSLEVDANFLMLDPHVHTLWSRYAAVAFVPDMDTIDGLDKWLSSANAVLDELSRRVLCTPVRRQFPIGPPGEEGFDVSSARYYLVAPLPKVAEVVCVFTDSSPQLLVPYQAREDGGFYSGQEALSSCSAPSRSPYKLPNPLLMVLRAMHDLRRLQYRFANYIVPSGLQETYARMASLEKKIYYRVPHMAAPSQLLSVVHVLKPSGEYEWVDRHDEHSPFTRSLFRADVGGGDMEDYELAPGDSASARSDDCCSEDEDHPRGQIVDGGLWWEGRFTPWGGAS